MRYFILVLTLLLFPSFSYASIKPADFAYGRSLSLKGNGAVYRLELPLEVYQTVATKDLSDIRIFNGSDVAVPYFLRIPEMKNVISENANALPLFPLYEIENATGNADFSVRIHRREDGTIINIESDDTGAAGGQRLSGYLIDMSRHGLPIGALDLTWPAGTGDFITEVALDYSEDLTKWETLVYRSTIALKRFGGREIVMKRIPIPEPERLYRAIPHKKSSGIKFAGPPVKEPPVVKKLTGYLRLRWLNDSSGPELKGILAVHRTGEPRRNRIWTVIDEMPKAGDSNEKTTAYEYDGDACLPADQMRVSFPEKNTLARVRVLSRSDLESKWRFRQGVVLYNLLFDNTTLKQDTIQMGLASDRYWRLEIEGRDTGNLEKSPVVKLGWVPHELLFVAQGEGPFVLAYGSARIGEKQPEKKTPELISQVIGKNKDTLIKKASLSEKFELGGPELLVPLPPPLPWRDWLLWCVLIVGVGIIAKMAISLFKSMDKGR